MRPSSLVVSSLSSLKSQQKPYVGASFSGLLSLFPVCVLAQEERAAEKAEVQKARQEAAAKQQASPDPVSQTRRSPKRIRETRKEAGRPYVVTDFQRLETSSHRTGVHVWSRHRVCCRPKQCSALFRCRCLGWSLEDDKQRCDLDAGVRQGGLLLNRRHRARSKKSADRLGRHWREQQPAQCLVW